jgi:hypothetical protein
MESRVDSSLYRKEIGRVEQEVYANTVEACEDNNAFFLLALNQEFGFGPERLKRVIHRYNELTEEYSVMRNDGFTYDEINQKMREALASIGIDPDDVYVGKNDFYDAKRRKRYIDKGQKVNRKEAEEVRKKFEQFRSLSESAYEKKDLNELIASKIRKGLTTP